MKALTITLVQADLRWEDPNANRQHLTQLLARHLSTTTTELVLLPEMFTSGFTMQPGAVAESMQGPTVAWLQEMAQQYQTAIAGSFVCMDQGQYFNRLAWVQPDASVQTYDKRHLFSYAGEHEHYQAGQSQLLVEYRGWRIMPLICYDLRFPAWSRNVQDYDLLIYVANFPDKRGEAWRTLLRARAIENQVYTVGVNRVGTDANAVYYAGDSCLINYDGKVVEHLPPREQVQTVTLDYTAQSTHRARFAFLRDRDDFTWMV
ncbi:MAG: amidohydrolase [Bacteroidota bacterium]